MPIYEFRCEGCGLVFEYIQKASDPWPSCPECGSKQVFKLPTTFGFKDASTWRADREKSILKRARDYLIDGKIKEAERFLKKAQEYVKTDTINRISDALANYKPQKGAFVSRTEAIIAKKRSE